MSKTWTHASSAERFERLPKWAQTEMTRLRRQLAEAESYAEEIRLEALDPETKVFLAQYERSDIPLPADSRVLFKLDDGSSIEVAPGDRINSISVRGTGLGSGALGCYPESSNTVRVGVIS